MRTTILLLPILPLLAGACATTVGPADMVARPAAPRSPMPAGLPIGWRAVVSEADRVRLRNWRTTLVAALAQVRSPAGRARVAGEGALLQPDSALAGVTPPVGAYRCRMTKLGAGGAGPDYVGYPAFACRIAAGAGGTLTLAKLDGSQRPVGTLYPHDAERMIFLGTMVLGDERRALDYGRDPERDMAGALERIGPRRWRLLLPAPRWESLFDIMELVPA